MELQSQAGLRRINPCVEVCTLYMLVYFMPNTSKCLILVTRISATQNKFQCWSFQLTYSLFLSLIGSVEPKYCIHCTVNLSTVSARTSREIRCPWQYSHPSLIHRLRPSSPFCAIPSRRHLCFWLQKYLQKSNNCKWDLLFLSINRNKTSIPTTKSRDAGFLLFFWIEFAERSISQGRFGFLEVVHAFLYRVLHSNLCTRTFRVRSIWWVRSMAF
jgi:hypothetical protein